MILHTYDEQGYFVETINLLPKQPLPKFMVTDIAPPNCAITEIQQFIDGQWQVIDKPKEIPVVAITIDNISNVLADFNDSDNEYTVKENTVCIATGKGLIALANRNLRVPFVRTDTQRKVFMVGNVDDEGNLTLTLNFKTSGQWIVNCTLLNDALSQAEQAQFTLSINEHTFKVI